MVSPSTTWLTRWCASWQLPAVLAGESISLEDQLAQWEQRKSLETSTRLSCVDDVPTAQPALALAQKVIARVTTAGLPPELIPASIVTVTVAAERDAENELRTDVLEFMDTVRAVERAIAANRRDTDAPTELDAATALGAVSPDEWRRHWPAPDAEPVELPLVPEVVTDDDVLDDVDILQVDDDLDLPELADDLAVGELVDVDVDVDADQPSSVEPQ